MSFTHLHLHTQFSNLDGIPTSEQYAEKAKKNGHNAIAITDHGKMSGVYEHQEACDKYGLKPIFGTEAYVCEELVTKDNKGKRNRGNNYHLLLIAKNETGYKNLLKLNYISNADDQHFYYVPRLLLSEVLEHKEGLICTTGCMQSPINKNLRDGKIDKAKEIFILLAKEFKENFLAEIQLNEFTKQKSEDGLQEFCNSFIIEWAKEFNVPIVVTGDVHYLEEGENKVQNISIAIRNKQTISNLNFTIESSSLFYHTEEDYFRFNKDFGYNYNNKDLVEWCSNTGEISKLCNYRIPERDRMFIPSITNDDASELIRLSKEGLRKLFNKEEFKEIPDNYKQRLNKELEVLLRKGFASYLLVLQDILNFVDENGYLRGVGRGSAAGSLVCYALGITLIDPIEYGLIFERFLSDSRSVDSYINFFND